MPLTAVVKSGPWGLVARVLGCTLLIFALLQLWRPCYFLTDDNLSGFFPELTDIGRALKAGHSPFISQYLFGGDFNRLRDIGELIWDPFLMGPALLADTFAKFWILDVAALMFLLVTASGFALLAWKLREELALGITDRYILFYTLSYTFCGYMLIVGPSWINFLNNQGCLPWLVLGLLDRKLLRAITLITVVTAHQILCGYSPLTISSGICLSMLAIGIALSRRSVQPLFAWGAGNVMALVVLAPLLVSVLGGFERSPRSLGILLNEIFAYNIDAADFPFSFFFGTWAEPYAYLTGDHRLETMVFPYPRTMLPCAAAWCLIPALLDRAPWKTLHAACLFIVAFLVLLVVRPHWLAVGMYNLPFFHSMRWPFRESIQLLFFIHLLLLLRFPVHLREWQPIFAVVGLAIFLAPLPMIRVPTLNGVAEDRALIFSGKAERFWDSVKPLLKPGDKIVTVIDWSFWGAYRGDIPYTLLCTADFPSYFQVPSATGYSPTAPIDQTPIQTPPAFWFGAYRPDQMPAIVAGVPHARLIRVLSVVPIRLTLSNGDGPDIDLTPYMQAAGITEADMPRPYHMFDDSDVPTPLPQGMSRFRH